MHYTERIDWKGRRVLVVGMARSGIAATRALAAQGALPIINDSKPREAFDGALDELEELTCQWHLGENPEALLDICDSVVISPGVPIQSGFIVEAKRRGMPVIGELELGFQLVEGTVAAITGTNGKTTTTTLLGEMCKNAGRLTWIAGNIGYPLTALAGKTRAEDVVVVEVSSFQCESVTTLQPEVAAVLNISEDHLNRHGSMRAYIDMKRRVFARQSAQQVAVFNWDDPECRRMAEGLQARIAWFSRQQEVRYGAYVRDGEVVLAMDEPPRALCRVEEIGIPGAHNLENALAATVMAVALGVAPPVIRHTLRTFAGVEHRIEFVRELDGVRYINDSKGTNVDSTCSAVEAMRAPTVLLLGGSDKGVVFDALAACIARQPLMERVLLIGETAPLIAGALDAAGYARYAHHGTDFAGAIAAAREAAHPGWNVLLSPACASFDMFKDYEHRGNEFKRIVCALA